jgi:hypothetical protein
MLYTHETAVVTTVLMILDADSTVFLFGRRSQGVRNS